MPGDAKGLRVQARIETISPHPLATLAFDGVSVPADARIGEGGQGFKIAMSVLDTFRPTVGAAALGFARAALDIASGHAKTRKTVRRHARAICSLVQGHIAEMAMSVDAAALLVYRAAWAKDSGVVRITREAAMAKLYATEAAQACADKAVQILGGLGVVKGGRAESLYREVRALRIYEGASEVQKIVIARQVLG